MNPFGKLVKLKMVLLRLDIHRVYRVVDFVQEFVHYLLNKEIRLVEDHRKDWKLEELKLFLGGSDADLILERLVILIAMSWLYFQSCLIEELQQVLKLTLVQALSLFVFQSHIRNPFHFITFSKYFKIVQNVKFLFFFSSGWWLIEVHQRIFSSHERWLWKIYFNFFIRNSWSRGRNIIVDPPRRKFKTVFQLFMLTSTWSRICVKLNHGALRRSDTSIFLHIILIGKRPNSLLNI